MSLDQLLEPELAQLLEPVWTYLAVSHRPRPSDAIFVFGSRDLAVPRRAAALFLAGHGERIVVTGRFGPRTEGVFPKPEALVFRDTLLDEGVPDSLIVTEAEATNTLENVRFGMQALRATGRPARTALLVAKAFVMRRCLATFRRQYPGVGVWACPPQGVLSSHRDRPRAAFVARLVDEVARLERYGQQGDIIRQPIPSSVCRAVQRLESMLAT